MESLQDLARKKFPDLSDAEKRVVQAAPNGTVANCIDLAGGDDPEKADTWPKTRDVRADLIRWLCIDRAAREQVDPKGVRIWGARITEALDLSFTNVPFPLVLLRCRLEQDLDLKSAKMPLLSLGGSWTRAIFADGLNLEGDMFLTSGFHAEGGVRLPGASIRGNLDAAGGTFKNPNGDALNADGIRVTGDVYLRNGFSADGEVQLLNATIGGDLGADGGTFKNLKSDKNPNATGDALSADGISVTGDVFLRNGFSAEGEVRLLGATIGGSLSARGGTFKNSKGNALSADRVKVGGNVSLSDKFVAEGEVSFTGAEIKGQMVVDDARLDALIFESAGVMGPFFWRNIYKDLHPDFPNKEWNPSLDLTNTKVGMLVDREASWPEKGRLFLDGFVYDGIFAGPTAAKAPTDAKVPIDAKKRLDWLHRQPDELGYLPQPYEQLIAVLRRMGHENQVAKVAIAKQWDMRKHGALGWLGQNWFLYFAVGYGYRSWLAFVWLLILIVVGSCVFSSAHSANMVVPSDQAAYEKYENPKKRELPLVYPRFHPLLYSLDVVSPFDLGQKSHWRLVESISYWKYEFYSLFQLFAGWVLLLVAAAVPAGFIKKD